MNDSIIVYRNPLEKAMWESMDSNVFLYVMLLCILTVILFVCINFCIKQFPNIRKKRVKINDNITLTVSLILSFIVSTYIFFY